MSELLREMAAHIAQQQATIDELRALHSNDWQIMAEANVRAECLADFIYFYERAKFEIGLPTPAAKI